MNNDNDATDLTKIREQAAQWLIKIESDTALSSDEQLALNAWVNRSALHKEILTRMSQSWQDIDVLAAHMSHAPNQYHKGPATIPGKFIYVTMAIVYFFRLTFHRFQTLQVIPRYAVVLSVIVSVLLLHTNQIKIFYDSTLYSQQWATQQGQQTRYILPDNSILWLNSASIVDIQFNNDKRLVFLQKGEAHFEVQTDPGRPFQVITGQHITQAIGTAFSVTNLSGNLEVLVNEGQVKVTKKTSEKNDPPQTSESSTIAQLKAGQQLTLNNSEDNSDNLVITTLAASEIKRQLAWLDGKLVFNGQTLEEVVAEINQHTTLKIDISDEQLRQTKFGGHFTIGETDKLLHILESAFNVQVTRISDNHVRLSLKATNIPKKPNL